MNETLSALSAILQFQGTFRQVVPKKMSVRHLEYIFMSQLTVSKACVYEEATDAAGGAKGYLGALF